MNKNEIRHVADRIRSNKYRIFNKELAHYLGLNESIYIAYLVDQDNYFNDEDDEIGGWFYKQQQYIYLETSLKEDTIRRLNNKLIELNLIEVKKKGIPAKNYFRINYEELEKILDKSMENFHELKKKNDENLNNKFPEIEGTIPLKKSEQAHLNEGDYINNKYINKEINKDFKASAGEIDNNKYYKGEEIKGSEGNDVYLEEGLKTQESTPAPAVDNKKGLGPLIDMNSEKYPKELYPTINEGLKRYLLCHIGSRHLPTKEKWAEMLDDLWNFSLIKIPGATGGKFNVKYAEQILIKAINGKNGVPYPEFDDIFRTGAKNIVMEPQFNLNQSFDEGY